MQTAINEPLESSGVSIFDIGSPEERVLEENLLLQELTHRIKNELSSTIGFVALTAAQSDNDEVKTALAGVIQHIHDFARIYRALQMPVEDERVNAASYLRELCQSISRAKLQYKEIELLFVESPLHLNAVRCWRIGMIVSELITNASRHAFCGGRGKIQVELANRGALVECSVTDNGSPLENFRPGRGLKIAQSLARAIDGRIRLRFGATGTVVTLSFPLAPAEQNSLDSHRLDLSRALQR